MQRTGKNAKAGRCRALPPTPALLICVEKIEQEIDFGTPKDATIAPHDISCFGEVPNEGSKFQKTANTK